MTDSATGRGSTLDEAVDAALAKLGYSRDDIDPRQDGAKRLITQHGGRDRDGNYEVNVSVIKSAKPDADGVIRKIAHSDSRKVAVADRGVVKRLNAVTELLLKQATAESCLDHQDPVVRETARKVIRELQTKIAAAALDAVKEGKR